MKAWATSLDPSGASNVRAYSTTGTTAESERVELILHQIRFIADPKAEFTSALDLDFDATAIFGNRRSVRYALIIEDGKVKSTHIEPERTSVDGITPKLPGTEQKLMQNSLSSCQSSRIDHISTAPSEADGHFSTIPHVTTYST